MTLTADSTGGDYTPDSTPDSTPAGHTTSCACRANWRFVACDVTTGIERAILHPVSAEWQLTLNQVGTGSLTLATKDVVMRDIAPHAVAVYCTRVGGPGASMSRPVAEFAGLIETVSADDQGTTQVGMQSIEKYLDHRMVTTDTTYTGVQQTEICRRLAGLGLGAGNYGLQRLTAQAATSTIRRDKIYNKYEWKIIGEAIREMCELEDGPDYELRHSRSAGHWGTTIIFRDQVGADRDLWLNSANNVGGYSLDIDAVAQANRVHALGAGDGYGQLSFTAVNNTLYPFYPRYEVAPAFTDEQLMSTLRDQARGYLADYTEPTTNPSVTLYGLQDVPPTAVLVGDTVHVDLEYGAISYHGVSRIQSISWAIGADAPETRNLEFLTLDSPAQAVLGITPDEHQGPPQPAPLPAPVPDWAPTPDPTPEPGPDAEPAPGPVPQPPEEES